MKALISRITTVIKLRYLCALLLAAAFVMPPAAAADDAAPVDAVSVDARFDKTADGIVDAADWRLMSKDEQASYARASVEALGENPDIQLPGGRSRAEIYLDGLKAVYE